MTPSGQRITLLQPADLDAIGADWRALEARAGTSFFQSWTWTGCLAAEQFLIPCCCAPSAAAN